MSLIIGQGRRSTTSGRDRESSSQTGRQRPKKRALRTLNLMDGYISGPIAATSRWSCCRRTSARRVFRPSSWPSLRRLDRDDNLGAATERQPRLRVASYGDMACSPVLCALAAEVSYWHECEAPAGGA